MKNNNKAQVKSERKRNSAHPVAVVHGGKASGVCGKISGNKKKSNFAINLALLSGIIGGSFASPTLALESPQSLSTDARIQVSITKKIM